MFAAPSWAARNFPWDISPFVSMTIGAWYVGTGIFALECVRIRRFGTIFPIRALHRSSALRRLERSLAVVIGPWYVGRGISAVERVRIRRFARVYAPLLYVWLFGLLESVVVVVHGGDLEFDRTLAWPYLLSLGAGLVATTTGIADLVRTRPSLRASGPPNPRTFRLLSAVFVLSNAALAVGLLDGSESERVWPEALTLPAARTLAAFFGALALSAVAVTVTTELATVLTYLRTALALNAAVLVAALAFLGTFDFGAHPGQALYVGLYAAVLAGNAAMLAFARRNARAPQPVVGRSADATN
jgi:hypothetical protein